MKRPWTPGPWTLRLEPLDVNWWDNMERMANITLASKSPEMAELLIRWSHVTYKEFPILQEQTKEHLKEIGFNPESQEDS